RAPSKPAPAPPPAAPRPPPPSPSAAPGAQPAGSATAVPLPAPRPRPTPADTVALLIRDANDLFAVAASSGGPLLALPGRVGDVAVPGAGIYVGKQGAVAITGRGELLVELQLARKVYERLELTRSAR